MFFFLSSILLPTGVQAFNESELQKLLETGSCPGCDLRGADLTEANLYRADLRRTNLSGANLKGANLTGTYLTNANLAGTIMDTTIQVEADFRY
jgi:uncharacterized protein YjbI with pentapeptide repeats